jgi:RimJ/RimL family protein N-acetyltransferase
MELRANGLVLRPWKLEDAPALVEACNDPEIERWLPVIPSPYSETDAETYIDQSRESWEKGDSFNFAILDAETGRLAGSISMRTKRFSTGHLGYWVAREARGRGVAPEALRTLCRWAVEALDVQRLELLTDVDNRGSQRVAEKAGFQREGILRSSLEYRDGTRGDSLIFSFLAHELD